MLSVCTGLQAAVPARYLGSSLPDTQRYIPVPLQRHRSAIEVPIVVPSSCAVHIPSTYLSNLSRYLYTPKYTTSQIAHWQVRCVQNRLEHRAQGGHCQAPQSLIMYLHHPLRLDLGSRCSQLIYPDAANYLST